MIINFYLHHTLKISCPSSLKSHCIDFVSRTGRFTLGLTFLEYVRAVICALFFLM